MTEWRPLTNNPWTDDRIVKLKELWPDTSAANIANALGGGISRNAVIGRARRLGLASKKSFQAREKSRKRRPPRSTSFNPLPKFEPRPAPVHHDTPPRMVTLQELEPHHCRYGLGDPREADFRFCGADKIEGSSYCGCHFRLCHSPALQREQKFHHWGRRAA